MDTPAPAAAAPCPGGTSLLGPPAGLTSNRVDLVGDGVSQDPLLLHVHHKDPLHDDLQGLQGGGPVVVATVLIGDVLLQLEGEGLGASLRRHHRKLPHRGGGGDWKQRERKQTSALTEG